MDLKRSPTGWKGLTAPLAPASNDPVDHEPVRYTIMLLGAVVVCMYATWEIGYRLAEHGVNYITAAVPFFLLLIVIEAVILAFGAVRDSEGAQYRAADMWSSLAAGTVQQLWFSLFQLFFSYNGLYTTIWESYRLVELPTLRDGPLGYLTLFGSVLAADFAYYWFHRMAHEIAFLWAGHNVHHSSEYYNLATALRQSWRQSLLSPFWHMWAALLFPPSTFFVASQWVTIYQFWIHTCVVRRLGWIEYILNTPSHHRCHHDRRLHKNFAGVFIIWDRMFGTFQDRWILRRTAQCLESVGRRHSLVSARPSPRGPKGDELYVSHALPMSWQGWIVGPGYHTTTSHRPLPKYPPTDIMPRIRVHSNLTWPAIAYSSLHYIIQLSMYVRFAVESAQTGFDVVNGSAVVLFAVASLTSLGLLTDGGVKAVRIEMLRCAVGAFVFARWQLEDIVIVHVVSVVLLLVAGEHFAGDGSLSNTVPDRRLKKE